MRYRLANLRLHLEAVAQREEVSPKMISSYLLLLYSQEEHDVSTANISKNVIAGSHGLGNFNRKLSLDSSCFLLDSLEIGKSKYIDLRRILINEDITLPGYNRVAIHRSQICLIDEMEIVEREYPVGIGISYYTLLTHTVNRIISTNTPIDSDDQPLKIRISDGLDGSGSHRVYQQATSHPDLTTKDFLLFGFKVLSITNHQGKLLWKNSVPNSPFSIRPITILALQENLENVGFLMSTMVNKETEYIENNGLNLINGITASVQILRSQIDGKMAQILSGAGGACCQFCTTTFEQMHDLTFVQDGFPINRFISDAKIIFEEVDEERFLSLSSNERFNLTHAPLSDIDIIPGSPLHAYLRCFSWFMSLVSHLTAGVTKWSPTSTKVQYTKSFICGLLKEKLNLMIDCASSQGGTSTTGNVVRRCLVRKDDSERLPILDFDSITIKLQTSDH
ncbi:hypothetical protein LOD99_8778 [Oopsacas minuta]|uniref:V(D)J recombination-activating protein 1 RNase H domain-containing protein n=1 Tax=Oopsacas minuta TaxID=111878 RepID=A0AAV7JFV0_9METZ|nr:hypothetical protein LOD99_8778 [Oopsacas minuta]